MEYQVHLNFYDGTSGRTKTFSTLTELGLYLERIPSMPGFENGKEVTVNIEQIHSRRITQAALPFKIESGVLAL